MLRWRLMADVPEMDEEAPAFDPIELVFHMGPQAERDRDAD
jgi:hypothetical protein